MRFIPQTPAFRRIRGLLGGLLEILGPAAHPPETVPDVFLWLAHDHSLALGGADPSTEPGTRGCAHLGGAAGSAE